MSNIYLLGFMGAGKSTVGKLLAERLDLIFVDLDEEIVSEQQQTIPQIFAVHGEGFFRELECCSLRKIAGRDKCVVATGGGIVENPANIACIQSSGRSIFLETSWEQLIRRIGDDDNRPLANSEDDWSGTKERYERRLPLYRQADLIVKTDDKDVQALVDEIARCLEDVS